MSKSSDLCKRCVKECTKKKINLETKSTGSTLKSDVAQQERSLPTSLFTQHPFLPVDKRERDEARPTL